MTRFWSKSFGFHQLLGFLVIPNSRPPLAAGFKSLPGHHIFNYMHVVAIDSAPSTFLVLSSADRELLAPNCNSINEIGPVERNPGSGLVSASLMALC